MAILPLGFISRMLNPRQFFQLWMFLLILFLAMGIMIFVNIRKPSPAKEINDYQRRYDQELLENKSPLIPEPLKGEMSLEKAIQKKTRE